jgi:hypothetical protein
MTHTIGPWQAECEEGQAFGFVHNSSEGGRGVCDIRASKRVKHDDRRRADSWVMTSEDVANARLIAAAPDLLLALQFVMSDLNTTLDPEAALIIRSAIDKAKGEHTSPFWLEYQAYRQACALTRSTPMGWTSWAELRRAGYNPTA